jgi:hypothetical protein
MCVLQGVSVNAPVWHFQDESPEFRRGELRILSTESKQELKAEFKLRIKKLISRLQVARWPLRLYRVTRSSVQVRSFSLRHEPDTLYVGGQQSTHKNDLNVRRPYAHPPH